MKNYAEVETPDVSAGWGQLLPNQRVESVSAFCASRIKFRTIIVTRVLQDGQVFVDLSEPLPPAVRGSLLLDLESDLKNFIDGGLVVWCEPLGDKSTLRNLRGIEIRTERVTEPHR